MQSKSFCFVVVSLTLVFPKWFWNSGSDFSWFGGALIWPYHLAQQKIIVPAYLRQSCAWGKNLLLVVGWLPCYTILTKISPKKEVFGWDWFQISIIFAHPNRGRKLLSAGIDPAKESPICGRPLWWENPVGNHHIFRGFLFETNHMNTWQQMSAQVNTIHDVQIVNLPPFPGVVEDLGFDCHFWKCSEQQAAIWKELKKKEVLFKQVTHSCFPSPFIFLAVFFYSSNSGDPFFKTRFGAFSKSTRFQSGTLWCSFFSF